MLIPGLSKPGYHPAAIHRRAARPAARDRAVATGPRQLDATRKLGTPLGAEALPGRFGLKDSHLELRST